MPKAALIGSGIIGRQWAVLFLEAGYRVSLYDQNNSILDEAAAEISTLVQERSLDVENEKVVTCCDTSRLSKTTKLHDCVSEAAIILENLPENLLLKQKVFEAIDNSFSSFHDISSMILGSSSSTFKASDVCLSLKILKSRFMIIHPVNPSTYCKLVELVPSQFTDVDAIDEAYHVMNNLGQIPIKMKKDVPGFALNRLQVALIMECWKLVNQGVVSMADLHVAVTEGLAPLHIFFGSFEILRMDGDGIESFILNYGDHVAEVLETSAKHLNLEDQRWLVNIKEGVETIIPKDKMVETRKARDSKLAKVAKFKDNLVKKDQICEYSAKGVDEVDVSSLTLTHLKS